MNGEQQAANSGDSKPAEAAKPSGLTPEQQKALDIVTEEREKREAAERTKKEAAAKKLAAQTSGTPPAQSSPGASTTKGTEVSKPKKAKKSKEAKKKAPSAAPKKKREGSVTYPSTAKKCPYREGSMKEKAYGIFAKGGTREAMIAAIVKLGATDKTASSWIQFFRKYVATGKK